jgi:hypothetical protein
MRKTRKLLSAYTIARYCSDKTDVWAGIYEIYEKCAARRRANKIIPDYFYTRHSKLFDKLELLTEKAKQNEINSTF